MTQSSSRRKGMKKMYKRLKKEGKLLKPTKQALKPLPSLAQLPPSLRRPNHVTALSRVIDFEIKKPGEFGAWLTDLHIEHYRANFQEKLERQREQEESSKNSQEQAAA
jgi:hypothetical protein